MFDSPQLCSFFHMAAIVVFRYQCVDGWSVVCDCGMSLSHLHVFCLACAHPGHIYLYLTSYIVNTRGLSLDIKFTRQGFDNAC